MYNSILKHFPEMNLATKYNYIRDLKRSRVTFEANTSQYGSTIEEKVDDTVSQPRSVRFSQDNKSIENQYEEAPLWNGLAGREQEVEMFKTDILVQYIKWIVIGISLILILIRIAYVWTKHHPDEYSASTT